MTGSNLYLQTDCFKYARAGELVTVVNTDHGDVWLVTTGGGIFPCHKDRLGSEKPDELPAPTPPKQTINKSRKVVAKPTPDKNTLF